MGDFTKVIQEAFSKDPAYTIYSVGITLLSLSCFIRGITKSGDPLKTILHSNGMVRAWEIRWLDALLLTWCMFMAIFAQALLMVHVLPAGSNWASILGTLFMQLCLYGIFFAYQIILPYHHRLPLNTEACDTWKACKSGCYYLLASLPVIIGIAYIWQIIASLLEKTGIHINMEEQSFVLQMIETKSTWALFCMTGLAVVVAPIVEETIFRGGVYRFFKSRYHRHLAMILSGAFFALIHANMAGFPALLALGVALCIAYERTGNIKVPIFMHALFNLNSIIIIILQSSTVS
jgi:hypothetical protein